MVTRVQFEGLFKSASDTFLNTLFSVDLIDISDPHAKWRFAVKVVGTPSLYKFVTEKLDQRRMSVGIAKNFVDGKRFEPESQQTAWFLDQLARLMVT